MNRPRLPAVRSQHKSVEAPPPVYQNNSVTLRMLANVLEDEVTEEEQIPTFEGG